MDDPALPVGRRAPSLLLFWLLQTEEKREQVMPRLILELSEVISAKGRPRKNLLRRCQNPTAYPTADGLWRVSLCNKPACKCWITSAKLEKPSVDSATEFVREIGPDPLESKVCERNQNHGRRRRTVHCYCSCRSEIAFQQLGNSAWNDERTSSLTDTVVVLVHHAKSNGLPWESVQC